MIFVLLSPILSRVSQGAAKKSDRIDPRVFIGGPYKTCPRCRGQEFGILIPDVGPDSFTRRCKACWHTVRMPLPEIRKKVVYIDQSAFSNIMKVLSPETQGHERAAADPFWMALYEALDVACHLQLAACPDAMEHEQESLTSPFNEALKRTYEHFSCGLTFKSSEQIKLSQIASAARCFARKEALEFDFDPEGIVHGRLHGWLPRIFPSTSGNLPGTIDRLRVSRSVGHAQLEKLFQKWQANKPSFGEVFEQERNAYIPVLVQLYQSDRDRMVKARDMLMRGERPPLDYVLPSPSARLFKMLRDIFESEGFSDSAAMLRSFFESGVTNELPFNLIESLMFASLSQRAAAGQRKMPDQGTLNDISVVSTLLPYCEAMFVDNGCRALLNDLPKEYRLSYPCAVFSKNNGDDFLAYLRNLRDSVTPQHLEIMNDVYGPDPMKARGIYGLGKHGQTAQSN